MIGKFSLALSIALGLSMPLNAQFFKKLGEAAKKAAKTVEQVANGNKTDNANDNTKDNGSDEPTSYYAYRNNDSDPVLKNLYHGNFGTDADVKTKINIHETSATKTIVLDAVRGTQFGNFSCGRALIATPSNGAFYINESGEKVFEINGEVSWLNNETVERMEFDSNRIIEMPRPFSGQKVTIRDINGNVVKTLDNVTAATKFMNGVAMVLEKTTVIEDRIKIDKYKKKYININGEHIFPNLDMVSNAGNGLYVEVRPLVEERAAYFEEMNQSEKSSLSRGLLNKFKGRKWGFRDAKGNIIAAAKYIEVRNFSDGLAAVHGFVGEVDKWGYVDKTGKEVIPLKYTIEPSSFSNGIALVENKNGENFYIDKKGNTIKGPLKNFFIAPFHKGFSVMSGDDNYDKYNFIIDTNFNKIAYMQETFTENKFRADKESLRSVGGVYFTDDYIVDLDKFGVTNYTMITWKGDVIFKNIQSDFYEGKALFHKEENGHDCYCYINRSGEILVKFVENEF